MKKVFLALILLATAFVFFGTRSYAAGTGNLVVHFKAWDGNYDDLGSHAWGSTAVGKLKSGVDDFGAYFEFNDVAVGTSVGFIAVNWIGTTGPNWDEKLTGDVNIDASAIVENQTTHVYVFQGAATSADNPGHFIAKN
ncbi:MAG: pullulanase-associated domain-containing protein, partial [Acholeplasmataceae bacterium]|nr:pullulanase-associated domain-containing protein [Acholeplasmataceae bacterium]